MGSVVVLLFAVLPNVLYIGHAPADSHAHSHAPPHNHASQTSAGDHTLHCHTGQAQCGGPHSLTGASWFGDPGPSVHFPHPLRAVDTVPEPSYLLDIEHRILQPPRTAGPSTA